MPAKERRQFAQQGHQDLINAASDDISEVANSLDIILTKLDRGDTKYTHRDSVIIVKAFRLAIHIKDLLIEMRSITEQFNSNKQARIDELEQQVQELQAQLQGENKTIPFDRRKAANE